MNDKDIQTIVVEQLHVILGGQAARLDHTSLDGTKITTYKVGPNQIRTDIVFKNG